MWQLVFLVFLISLCIFAGIMVFEPRTLWSGVSFFWTMGWLALLLFLVLSEHTQWLASHTILIGLLAFLFVLSIVCVLAFPAVLILVFFIEGIRMVSHEGVKPSNLLSMALFNASVYLSGRLAGIWICRKEHVWRRTLWVYQLFRCICAGVDGHVYNFCDS